MSEIIGAGLCRTGTSSTLVALERLELGPVYHMKEVMARNLADKADFFNELFTPESFVDESDEKTSKVDELHRWQ